MSLTDISELLARYAKGETTPAENLRVETWLAGHQNPDSQWERMDPASREAWLFGPGALDLRNAANKLAAFRSVARRHFER